MLCLERTDYISTLLYLLFFIVVQTVFFKSIASKTYDRVLADKFSLFRQYSGHAQISEWFGLLQDEVLARNKDRAVQQKIAREEANYKLLYSHVYFFGFIIASLLLAVLVFTTGPWGKHEWIGLGLIGASYFTEIYIYYALVNSYIYVPDFYIVKGLVQLHERFLNITGELKMN